MRCRFVSDGRCKYKATEKYMGIGVCADHKRFLEERIKKTFGNQESAQSASKGSDVSQPTQENKSTCQSISQ